MALQLNSPKQRPWKAGSRSADQDIFRVRFALSDGEGLNCCLGLNCQKYQYMSSIWSFWNRLSDDSLERVIAGLFVAWFLVYVTSLYQFLRLYAVEWLPTLNKIVVFCPSLEERKYMKISRYVARGSNPTAPDMKQERKALLCNILFTRLNLSTSYLTQY